MKFKDYIKEQMDRQSYGVFNKMAQKHDAVEWDYTKDGYAAAFKKEDGSKAKEFIKDVKKTLGLKMTFASPSYTLLYVSERR